MIVGPETALAAGVADECLRRRIPMLRPDRRRSPVSNRRRAMPASWRRRSVCHLRVTWPRRRPTKPLRGGGQLGAAIVVKQDGLAAGKGVIVPTTDDATLDAIITLSALGPIVVEEQLAGPECSLMALCDGNVARPLPIAQDHKRIGEGDTGPNTGGMGAYAPAPIAFDADTLTATFIQPVIDHFAAAGTPYVGVLYAGLMLTADGPRLIEFNCRFGDPEAQAVLPLLDSDLAEVAMACCMGTLVRILTERFATERRAQSWLRHTDTRRNRLRARLITGLDVVDDDALVFLAGTDGSTVTGGRVLAVTGRGQSLAAARDHAYRRMSLIHFDGKQVRNDIGWRAAGAIVDVVRRRRGRHRRRDPRRQPHEAGRRAHARTRRVARCRQLRWRIQRQGHQGDG